MSKFNINRSPFLKWALAFVKQNPGCNKKDIVEGVPGCRSRRGIARRYAAIDKLEQNDLIVNQYITGNKYSYVVRNSDPKAYNLIKDPNRWCQGSYAKDEHGLSVSTRDSKAVCFCLLGSICKSYPDEASNREMTHLYNISSLNKEVTQGKVAPFNDTHSHTEVMKFLKAVNL